MCNAGHMPAVWLHNGQVTTLKAASVPLGMFSSVEYASQSVRLAGGDTLFLYTDGLTETRSKGGEEYGEERLVKVLERAGSLAPEALIKACVEDVQRFRADGPGEDDLSLMAIRRAA